MMRGPAGPRGRQGRRGEPGASCSRPGPAAMLPRTRHSAVPCARSWRYADASVMKRGGPIPAPYFPIRRWTRATSRSTRRCRRGQQLGCRRACVYCPASRRLDGKACSELLLEGRTTPSRASSLAQPALRRLAPRLSSLVAHRPLVSVDQHSPTDPTRPPPPTRFQRSDRHPAPLATCKPRRAITPRSSHGFPANHTPL